mgnify:CR=1 FL=1
MIAPPASCWEGPSPGARSAAGGRSRAPDKQGPRGRRADLGSSSAHAVNGNPIGQPAYGSTALVLSTTDFDGVHAALSAAGSRFLTPPVRYPKRQASERSPAGIYREMIVYDPDGVPVSKSRNTPPKVAVSIPVTMAIVGDPVIDSPFAAPMTE